MAVAKEVHGFLLQSMISNYNPRMALTQTWISCFAFGGAVSVSQVLPAPSPDDGLKSGMQLLHSLPVLRRIARDDKLCSECQRQPIAARIHSPRPAKPINLLVLSPDKIGGHPPKPNRVLAVQRVSCHTL